MPRKNKSSAPAAPRPLTGPQRLNKLLAAAGLGSRRQVEQYILEGRIEVDGQAVTDLATKFDPEDVKLTFDGSAIKIFRPVYFALNKPVGVLSTNRDPSGRMRAIDLVNVKERIFSAGRLDRSSEGLMLLTNDGELAQRLSHPRYGIQKLYLATVQGEITQVDLEKLIRGVRLSEGYAKVDAVKVRRQRSGSAELEIALSEGKNREIRRILARLGHKVVGLKRLAIGPLRLGLLPTGGWRPLTRTEIEALYGAAVTGRRKKRGLSGKPPRTRGSDDDDTSGKPASLAAGQFDRYSDDDDDDIPSLDENFGDEFGDEDEIIALNDDSVIGTVMPYNDAGDQEDDEDNYVDGFGEGFNDSDEDEGDDSDDEGFFDSYDEESESEAPRPRAKPTAAGRSPHDIRNRKTGGPGAARSSAMRNDNDTRGSSRGGPRSGSRTGFKAGVKSSRSAAPRAGAKRSTGKPFKSGTGSRSSGAGPRTGSAGPRSGSAPRTGGARGAAKGGVGRIAPAGGPRSSGSSRSSSGPRSAGPRSAGPRSSGTGSSGPSSTSRSGPSRSGPSRGGPKRGGSGGSSSGPSRGGAGPKRGGGGPKRGGPSRGGPSRGKR